MTQWYDAWALACPVVSLEDARYARMRWNTPLSDDHARLLLDRLDIGSADTILDLGCGWGELLTRAVSASPGSSGVGVDRDADLLGRARIIAERHGLAERIEFAAGDAAGWEQPGRSGDLRRCRARVRRRRVSVQRAGPECEAGWATPVWRWLLGATADRGRVGHVR